MTGGRVKRLEPLLSDDTFMVTYGDGVARRRPATRCSRSTVATAGSPR